MWLAGVCSKAGLDLFLRHRQRHPQLDAVADVAFLLQVLGRALGMHNAASRRHPVDGAGLNALHRANAVAVQDGAVKQVGDRGQADVRMRPHVMAAAWLLRHRAEMVEEDERPHALAPGRGQQPAHHKAAAQVLVVACQLQFNAHSPLRVLLAWFVALTHGAALKC
jgi:hypothetical protein